VRLHVADLVAFFQVMCIAWLCHFKVRPKVADVPAWIKIIILNREQLSNATTLVSSLSTAVSRIVRTTNTLPNACLNISAHYDISNAMFAAFLSPDMTYSWPIWSAKSSPKSKTETLEEAQMTKLDYCIKQARINKGDHVLEIGTRWGSFAIRAVQKTGCRVTSLTLSHEQKELAEKRIAEIVLTDDIEILLCDYRALPTPIDKKYDKVVSIEMLEAVGREFLDTYFECVDRLLKRKGGIAVFQCITILEARYEAYSKGEDLIRKYIFPVGHLPSVSQLVKSIQRGSKGTLIVHNLLNIERHYVKTLRSWRDKFDQNFESDIRPVLHHQGMTDQRC
jgi:cyclopropane-fatty-acyl-phospholipid synthase